MHVLLRDGDGVLVAGRFASLGDTFAPNLARLAADLEVEPLTDGRVALGGSAQPLTLWRGDLVAGHVRAGDVASARLGVFDGDWHAIPGDPPVVDVHAAFAHADGALTIASDVIVQWDGAQWLQVADARLVRRPLLIDAEDALYVAVADPTSEAADTAIERWRDGEAWSLGVVDFRVTSITVHEGDLVTAGFVLTDDGAESPRMAIRRDGTWLPVDVSLTAGIVDAVVSSRSGVVVQSTNGQVAAWDGAAWTTLANQGATAIAACDTGFYAAFVENSGTAARTRTLELHDGSTWRTLDSGRPGITTKLVPSSAEIWVGGGANGDSGIARWSFAP